MAGGLCRECHRIPELWEKADLVSDSPFRVTALYEWKSGESDFMSRLVLAHKGGGARELWGYRAELLAKKRVGALGRRSICIVPAPARKEGDVDHAYMWGECLASVLGASLYPCLRRVSKTHQRGADRGERALVEMKIREKYTDPSGLSAEILWIFVDDVFTTGATARAAYRALGNPPHFEVWVLAYRSLPCGGLKDLL